MSQHPGAPDQAAITSATSGSGLRADPAPVDPAPVDRAPGQGGASTPLITVDVWTDVVCPWCYVGEARLHDAIAAEGLQDQVRVRAHSFELDPTAPAEAERSAIEAVAARKGIPVGKMREMESQIQAMAHELGREYRTDRPSATTRPVHRVLQALTEASGGEAATGFFLDLQRGYFTGALNPFEESVVIDRAVEAGLSPEVARDAYSGRTHDQAVDAEVRQAAAMGARGVPFFLFNDTYTAPGALPLDTFREALAQIAAEARGRREDSQA